MKFYPNNIEIVIQKIKSQEINSVFLFGPDYGMIREFVKKIQKALDADCVTYDKVTIEEVFVQLMNKNLFDKKKMLKLDVKALKFEDSFREIIEKKSVNFLVLVGDDVEPSNKYRKLYEVSDKLAIIGCYPDNDKGVKSIIAARLTSEKKHITPDALEYMIEVLEGNRLRIANELDKILLYTYSKQKITIEDCFNSLSSSIDINPDMACIYFAKKMIKDYVREVDILLEQQISNVWVIRALARYFQNMLIVKLCELDGMSVDEAMKLLKPPIFFKYVSYFKEIARQISIDEVKKLIYILLETEIEAKKLSETNILDIMLMNRIN